jgi:uncharacterized protein YkwD
MMQIHWFRLLKLGFVMAVVLLGAQAVIAARSSALAPSFGMTQEDVQVVTKTLFTINKTVTPTGTVNYGDTLTYTLAISAPTGMSLHLYDPLSSTPFIDFVQHPAGITHTDSMSEAAHALGGVITGTLTGTTGSHVIVSFVTQVGAPSTAGWTMDITNRACLYPIGGTRDDCTWSNQVVNSALHLAYIYLPAVIRQYPPNLPPYAPNSPSPADGATDQTIDVDISWTGGDPNGEPVTYAIYLEADDETPDTLKVEGHTTTTYDPGTLDAGTHYYWQVIATDARGATTNGPVWDFTTTATSPSVCLTPEEVELVRLVNEYRNQNGLPDVPASVSLTEVAHWHVIDLHENEPDSGTDSRGLACNMHSWSDQHPELWTPVCYTNDHEYAEGMWDKPYEITDGVYSWTGYENAYGTGGQATAEGALSAWKSSAGHNAVILELNIWSGSDWPAVGVGIYEHHAVLWFGDGTDPQGTVEPCP